MTLTVYGIRQCDTCRKALRWLEEEGIEHRFHDLREDGLDARRLKRWLASPHRQALVNRRSATWRQLTREQREAADENPLELLLAHPTLIKRPVFDAGAPVGVGFDEKVRDRLKAGAGRNGP